MGAEPPTPNEPHRFVPDPRRPTSGRCGLCDRDRRASMHLVVKYCATSTCSLRGLKVDVPATRVECLSCRGQLIDPIEQLIEGFS